MREEDIQSYHKHLSYSLLKENLVEFSLGTRTEVGTF